MSKSTSTITIIGNFHRLQNGFGWVILAQLDSCYLRDHNSLAGHLIGFAWKLMERMVKKITIHRVYELLEEQTAVYLETGRRDSKLILKKTMLTKRKTYPYPLWKIEIGSDVECLAAIFPPQGEVYKRKERKEDEGF